MFRKSLIVISLTLTLYGSDIGCFSSIQQSPKSCSLPNLLQESSVFVLDNLLEEKSLSKSKSDKRVVKISKNLDSITTIVQKKSFKIERIDNRECPPYCIAPMGIDGVKSVGELETLDFMKAFKKNRDRLLVDARGSLEYKKSTIPSAVNIPYSMLSPKSKYREEILKLLGVKRYKKSWYFKRVHKLLIFDNGILDNRAIKIINALVKIGYPKNKLLYYRGGLESWKRVGLTLL